MRGLSQPDHPLLAGVIALRRRLLATGLATFVFVASIVVGILGAYFHVLRGALTSAPPGEQLTVSLLIWAPPILAPLMFALVGLFGISAAWLEDPPDSGVLRLWRDRRLKQPYAKTNVYLFMVSFGALVSLVSSTLDHAQAGFDNPWLWIPIVAGALATVASAVLGAPRQPSRADIAVYSAVMELLPPAENE